LAVPSVHAVDRKTGGAFLQVLFFRLVLFRLAEELAGTWLAWVGTAAVFGEAFGIEASVIALAASMA